MTFKQRDSDKPRILESSFTINDVVCGRGTKYCSHSGNQTYHALVRHFIPDYAMAKRKMEKTQISKAIVEAVNNANPSGRFLIKSKDNVTFIELDGVKAREKTSQLLRETVMIGQTNHRTMYQKKKYDKVMKKRSEKLNHRPQFSTSVSVSSSSTPSRKFMGGNEGQNGFEESFYNLNGSRYSPDSVIGHTSEFCRTNESIPQPPLLPQTSCSTLQQPYSAMTSGSRASSICDLPQVPAHYFQPYTNMSMNMMQSQPHDYPPQGTGMNSNLLPVQYATVPPSCSFVPSLSPGNFNGPLPLLPHQSAMTMYQPNSMGPSKQLYNGNANKSTSTSSVQRLRDEIKSWRNQPSPATIAELENLAELQDKEENQNQIQNQNLHNDQNQKQGAHGNSARSVSRSLSRFHRSDSCSAFSTSASSATTLSSVQGRPHSHSNSNSEHTSCSNQNPLASQSGSTRSGQQHQLQQRLDAMNFPNGHGLGTSNGKNFPNAHVHDSHTPLGTSNGKNKNNILRNHNYQVVSMGLPGRCFVPRV